MILFIDTANTPNSVGVATTDYLRKISWRHTIGKNQRLLLKIERLLSANNVKISDISAIAVNPGPGSYTGLRVGVGTANALAWALTIPVYSFKNRQDLSKIITDSINKKGNKEINFVYPIYTNL